VPPAARANVEYDDRSIRVGVWGDDDIGMIRDFRHVDRQEAHKVYDSIVDGVTTNDLRALGLTNF
jgi:hypothetical protein